MTDFSFYLCPKCGYNSKIVGDDLVEKYHRKVIREFLEKHAKKFIELYEWETTNIEEILKQLEGED